MRFRFTIRDLLWLTLAVAMGLGWWVDHRAIVQNQRADHSRGFVSADGLVFHPTASMSDLPATYNRRKHFAVISDVPATNTNNDNWIWKSNQPGR